jgi:putative hydrolase of the HAD superfamily
VIDTYRHAITAVPPLLAGVREGLELARAEGLPVYVITEGPLAVARDRIVQLGLSALTAGVLSATKTVPLYLRLADKASPMVAAMVGDQPDKDVRLAHEAGLLTVLVPGRFQPSWTQAKDAELADAVCVDYAGAISWLLSARPGGCLHEGR